MKIAYKPYSLYPDSFEVRTGIPVGWPKESKGVDDSFGDDGWTVITKGEFDSLIESLTVKKEIWNEVVKDPKAILEEGKDYKSDPDGTITMNISMESLISAIRREVDKR